MKNRIKRSNSIHQGDPPTEDKEDQRKESLSNSPHNNQTEDEMRRHAPPSWQVGRRKFFRLLIGVGILQIILIYFSMRSGQAPPPPQPILLDIDETPVRLQLANKKKEEMKAKMAANLITETNVHDTSPEQVEVERNINEINAAGSQSEYEEKRQLSQSETKADSEMRKTELKEILEKMKNKLKQREMKEVTEDTKPVTNRVVTEKNSRHPKRRIPLITSCSSHYFKRLQNLIGSVHYWEPTLEIKLYDLGLTPEQVTEASNWMNVEIRKFDFEKYPPHVRNLRNFAWKPLVMKDALEKDGYWILYQDAGQEFRRSIEEAEELIERKGYMYVAQDGWETKLQCCGRIGELTVPSLYPILGVKKEDYESQMMCAGGIQGYKKSSDAVTKVLDPVIECVLNKECIEPPGADAGTHRYDQSVFSIIISKNGFKCQKDPKFWANRGNNRSGSFPQGISPDETVKNNVIFFSRRGWGIDYDNSTPYKMYQKHLKTKK